MDERVAQTTFICDACGKKIHPGHRYLWKHDDDGQVIYLKRIHPGCKEEKSGTDQGQKS